MKTGAEMMMLKRNYTCCKQRAEQ